MWEIKYGYKFQSKVRKMKKRAIILSAVLALVFLLSACRASSGELYFDSGDEIDVASVTHYVNAEGRDITQEVDMDALIALLHEMECGKNRRAPHSYSMNSVRYEIDGICSQQPFHIVLGDGDLNFIYSTMDEGNCPINEPDVLKAFLDNR